MAGTYGSPATQRHEPSGWAVGYTAFAGTMMVIQGIWWFIAGLVALANDQFLVVTPDYVFRFDTTTWAWIHIVLGIVIFAAGVAIFSGAVWARIIGVMLAIIASVVAFGWLPYYPVWGILLIVLSVGVIWALTAHGRDVAELD
jgi:hypothetical protein